MFLHKRNLVAALLVALGALSSTAVPQEPAPADPIEQLVARLSSRDFPVRQKAAEELEKLGAAALPALDRVLKANPDLETKTRAERLVVRIKHNIAEALDRKWAALGKEKHAVKRRLTRVLAVKAPLGDEQLVHAAYLLTLARVPTEAELERSQKRLRAAGDRTAAVLDMAWPLANDREFNESVAAANIMLLKLQDQVRGQELLPALQSLNSDDTQAVTRNATAAVLKGAAGLTDRHLGDLAALLTVSRLLTEKESKACTEHLAKKKTERAVALDDIIWAFINTKEFIGPR